MKLLCPAKINWTLEVLGKRPDGFHQIQSWFAGISLCDELACQTGSSGISVFGIPNVPTDESNLVLRAETAWRDAGGEAPQISWALHKGIPMAAGLGGGSSNAAGALRLLEAVATKGIGINRCKSVAEELGSDVPFFMDGCGWQLRGGRGERLLQEADQEVLHLVVATPNVEISTPKVFQALNSKVEVPKDQQLQVQSVVPLEPGPNHLQDVAYELEPRLREFSEHLQRHANFQMSGSGGAHFLEVEDAALGHLIAGALKDEGINAYPVRTLVANELQVESL